MSALDFVFKRWPWFALGISALMLAIAHGFQTFGNLAPCHLCLKQREVYWWAMAVAGIAVLASLTRFAQPAPRIASLILAAVFAWGAYLAIFHAGAEWHWWPAPAGCASTGVAVSAKDLMLLLSGTRTKVPVCDVAPWYFLGLSMAGWNAVASIGLVGLCLTAAARKARAA